MENGIAQLCIGLVIVLVLAGAALVLVLMKAHKEITDYEDQP